MQNRHDRNHACSKKNANYCFTSREPQSALVLEIFCFRLRNAVVQTARNISKRRKLNFNLPLTVHAVASSLFFDRPACKPGSVKNDHQSVTAVADSLRATYRGATRGYVSGRRSPCGVASDRVYSKCMLPYKWVSSYLAFPSLPLRAVYFCCTFPAVTRG